VPDYQRLRTPLSKMSFTPDIPSNALGPNEYNSGRNVETDLRGIRKADGEAAILSAITGNPIYIDGGFRSETTFVYIVATSQGRWWMVTNTSISNITPGVGANPSVALSGYSDDTIITSSIVGGVFFFNDGLRPPMYFAPGFTEMRVYNAAPDNYVWNYEPSVSSVTAGFVRSFSSPNVGNILIAGNLTKNFTIGTTVNYPTTVRWSQAFAQTGIPETWEPTLNNVANEQEVPVRGPLIDGFMLGANFYVFSYWDAVVFSPISYQSSTAPIFGVRQINNGRGLLSNNCFAVADNTAYGFDSRDIWIFDGGSFDSIANQKIKNYFFSNLNPTYAKRAFMVNNSKKYRIEIYYPDLTSTGWCNKMISYRYDLQVWNPPKDIDNACQGAEGPVFNTPNFDLSSRTVVYARNTTGSQMVQTGQGYSLVGNAAMPTLFERTNIYLESGQGPVPYSMRVYLHRSLPEVSGTGTIDITVGGANSVGQTPKYGQMQRTSIDTDTPWVGTTQNAVRTAAVKVETNNNSHTFNLSALNWQATVVEDAF